MVQQIRIEETIAAMKRAMKRNDSPSESDDSLELPTNRGNKLKRKAKYVQEGHLGGAAGPQSYKRRVDYNGYVRHIIHHNAPRVDPDGDVIEDDDGNSSTAELTSAEDDPYRDVKLERLLKPLTSAAELKDHPSLALPYHSQILEEMVQNAQEMVHREHAALWRMKQVLTSFRGDESWVPCGAFLTDNDFSLLRGSKPNTSAAPSITADPEQTMDGYALQALEAGKAAGDVVDFARTDDLARDLLSGQTRGSGQDDQDANNQLLAESEQHNESEKGGQVESTDAIADIPATAGQPSTEAAAGVNGVGHEIDGDSATATVDTKGRTSDSLDTIPNEESSASTAHEPEEHGLHTAGDTTAAGGEVEEGGDDGEQQGHRMTTRARAQAENPDMDAASDDGEAARTDAAPSIHPFFLPPLSVLPDKSNGLASDLADETRRLLCAYVQKQEEICRGAQELYRGLLRALRLRKLVLEWCTSEAHVGELSDGEDWYDKDKWGLEDDLKKGEEVEDDDANTTGKKTRNRRAAA